MFKGLFGVSKKAMLAKAFSYSKVFTLTNPFSVNSLTIFNYHRISGPKGTPRPFADSVFGPTEEVFRKHLLRMKEYADPISENDLYSFIHKKAPLPKRSFMITFDDGYSDNYERAVPILSELSIPAMFFVPTLAVEERLLSWWDQIYWILKKTKKKKISVFGDSFVVPEHDVQFLAERLILLMTSVKTVEKGKLLVQELSNACGVPIPGVDECHPEIMTWDQIRDAEKKGITIGSHTHTHRVLSCLNLQEQKDELVRSKKILEERLGHVVRSLAYPVGGYEHFNSETMDIAKECGYEMAFSFLTGVNRLNSLNTFDIKRIDRQSEVETYAGVFSMPWLFGKRSCALDAPVSSIHK